MDTEQKQDRKIYKFEAQHHNHLATDPIADSLKISFVETFGIKSECVSYQTDYRGYRDFNKDFKKNGIVGIGIIHKEYPIAIGISDGGDTITFVKQYKLVAVLKKDVEHNYDKLEKDFVWNVNKTLGLSRYKALTTHYGTGDNKYPLEFPVEAGSFNNIVIMYVICSIFHDDKNTRCW